MKNYGLGFENFSSKKKCSVLQPKKRDEKMWADSSDFHVKKKINSHYLEKNDRQNSVKIA